MKKLIKKLSILMMSAIMILSTVVLAQAEEVNNDTEEVVEYTKMVSASTYASTYAIPSGYTIKATITGNNVNLRNYSGVSLGQLNKGDVVYLKYTDVTVINGIPSRRCYSPKHGYYGYVSISYMNIN